MMIRTFLVVALGVVSVAGMSCSNHDEPNSRRRFPTRTDVLSLSEVQAFRQRMKLVDLGSSAERVVSQMGDPNYDDILFRKENSSEILGRALRYSVSRVNPSLPNIQDKEVIFFFNEKDRLTMIYSNVDGIASVGVPSPNPYIPLRTND
jgi:hypothetical protein